VIVIVIVIVIVAVVVIAFCCSVMWYARHKRLCLAVPACVIVRGWCVCVFV